jgi:hypothetical protein
MARVLSGIDVPCQKDVLVRHAEGNGAEADVLELLHSFPEDEYKNMADVMKGYGKARHAGRQADQDEREE